VFGLGRNDSYAFMGSMKKIKFGQGDLKLAKGQDKLTQVWDTVT
jgi:hypothetical protein